MINIQKLVTSIKLGIHRVNFSIPITYTDTLTNYFNLMNCECLSQYHKNNYYHQDYFINNDLLLITTPTVIDHFFKRSYLGINYPSVETQLFLKHAFSLHVQNVLIDQLEAPCDFFTNTDDQLRYVKRYIDHHSMEKGARLDSYRNIFGTKYFGRKKNSRNGEYGVRVYLKDENDEKFCRDEKQLNRGQLKKQNITYMSMPFDPIQYNVFGKLQFLDDFSENGIKNISNSILRKQGIDKNDSNYKILFKETSKELRTKVLGGSRGATKKVSTQLIELKKILKKHGLTINPKTYFPELPEVKQLFVCLADVGYEEINCSKRMMTFSYC